MRRILALSILLTVVALWVGCGGEKSTAPNSKSANSTGTTTYPDSAPSTTAAPSGGGAANSNASNTSAPTRIKPPT